MAEIRVNFGDDDRENEQFLGFNLDNIEEAEERYIRQLDVLNNFDFNIEFSEMGSSDKEEIDSDVDTVLADIAKWSDPLRPIKSLNLRDQRLLWRKTKKEIFFFNLLFPEALKLLLKQTNTCQYAHRFFHLGVHVPYYLHFWGTSKFLGVQRK